MGAAILWTLVSRSRLAHRDGAQNAPQRDSSDMAYVASQSYIKKQFLASSTAKFPPSVRDTDEVHVVRLPDGGYRVWAWVDIQRHFGMKKRYNWSCQLKQVTDANWVLEGYCGILPPPGGVVLE